MLLWEQVLFKRGLNAISRGGIMLEVLIGLLGFVLGVATTSLTFGLALTNKVTTVCADIRNLTLRVDAHIQSEPRQCPAHEAVFKQVQEANTQIAVNTQRLEILEKKG